LPVQPRGHRHGDGPATKLEGSVTAGYDLPSKDAMEKAKATALAVVGGPVFWQGVFPRPKNQFIIRAEGPPGVNRENLYALCLGVALNRFQIRGGLAAGALGQKESAVLVSLFFTSMIHETAVQLVGEPMGTAGQQLRGAAIGLASIIKSLNVKDPV
jgi:hypothetical protein